MMSRTHFSFFQRFLYDYLRCFINYRPANKTFVVVEVELSSLVSYSKDAVCAENVLCPFYKKFFSVGGVSSETSVLSLSNGITSPSVELVTQMGESLRLAKGSAQICLNCLSDSGSTSVNYGPSLC